MLIAQDFQVQNADGNGLILNPRLLMNDENLQKYITKTCFHS